MFLLKAALEEPQAFLARSHPTAVSPVATSFAVLHSSIVPGALPFWLFCHVATSFAALLPRNSPTTDYYCLATSQLTYTTDYY